jgi:hypothetical protein
MIPFIPAIIILILAYRKYNSLGSRARFSIGHMIGSMLAWTMVITFWLVGTLIVSYYIFPYIVKYITQPIENWIWGSQLVCDIETFLRGYCIQ